MLLFGCSRLDERKINADTARETSISRLEQGKTYMTVDGLDDAMAYYQENNDTTKFLEVCQLLAIRTRWNGKPRSHVSTESLGLCDNQYLSLCQ
ncbi:MAG: hypothetical protein K2M71_07405 [Duncaniella sp.]|nr:hypothetical protein [Duncaniella sp.]